MMREIAEKTARRMITIANDGFGEECPISIIDMNKWEWAQGVGLYGLYRYCCAGGACEYMDFLTEWYDARLAEGLPEKNVNTCAPLLTLTYLYERTKKPAYLAVIREWAAWVAEDMPRTEDGGLQHITTGIENKGQLWADTLFMTNLFFARVGVILGKPEYIDESKR